MKIILLIVLLAIGGTNCTRPRRATSGESVSRQDAAFFVSIRSGKEHKCGGALVSDKIVITSGRCVVNEHYERYPKLSVRTAKSLEKGSKRSYNVKRILFAHGNTRRPNATIAALVLSKKIPAIEKISLTEVPEGSLSDIAPLMCDVPLVGTLVTLNSGGPLTNHRVLRQLKILIETDHKFSQVLGSPTRSGYGIGKSFIGKNSCHDLVQGDEGSPLVYESQLVGIATGQMPIGTFGYIYLDVHQHTDFLYKAMFQRKALYAVE